MKEVWQLCRALSGLITVQISKENEHMEQEIGQVWQKLKREVKCPNQSCPE